MGKPAGSAALSFIVLVGLTLLLGLAGYVGYTYMETPLLLEVSPNPARPADMVSLKGDRFSSELGGNIVLFGDKVGKVQRATTGLIEVQVPEVGILKGEVVRLPVRVLSRGRVSQAVDLSVKAVSGEARAPEVARVAPSPPPLQVETWHPAASETPAVSSPASPPSAGDTEAKAPPAPSRRPRPSPSASAASAPRTDVSGLLGEAEAALAANRPEAAAGLYDKALEADPGNARAKSGKAAAQTAASSLKRSFSSGNTQAEGKVSRDKLKEFDGVAMKKPAEVPAQIAFEVSPARLKAGDAYAVKIFLVNEGTKSIRISSLTVNTTVNGAHSGGPSPPRAPEVPPGERAWIHETSGTWRDGVASWTLEAQVTSGRGDSYRNRLNWK